MTKLIIDSYQDWTFDKLGEITKECNEIAMEELELDCYDVEIEIINSEQMLDAYSSVGLPVMYNHWSFGKSFNRDQYTYRKGHTGLAYEIVINSDPCICYCMERNDVVTQSLVIAHAAFGHNAFFKNNYMFEGTQPDFIVDYLIYARNYIADQERIHGKNEVERLLDACHTLRDHGVDIHKKRPPLSRKAFEQRQKDRKEYEQKNFNPLFKSLLSKKKVTEEDYKKYKFPEEPEENLLYFIEKNAPHLDEWEREIVRIIRTIAQYFYPQLWTKVMNEGMACFTHYYIMRRLYEKGILTDGAWIEFINYHTSVIKQPDFNDPHFSGINPYALGFNMYQDVVRICKEPTEEDGKWLPDIAGKSDGWLGVVHDMFHNYRDDSAIYQFLSPKLMRDFKFFSLRDDESRPFFTVSAIHSDDHSTFDQDRADGYSRIRRVLSAQHDRNLITPNIQVVNVNILTDNSLTLKHTPVNGKPLHIKHTQSVVDEIAYLWRSFVLLESEHKKEKIDYISDWHL